MKHFSIHVYGKVQGVFFRASTQEKAHELFVNGFVRNEPDESVYIEVEGDETNLDSFIEWCEKGPRMAKVERCDVVAGQVKGYKGFTIQR